MQGGGAEPRVYGNATVFSIRGVCEVLTEDHERPSQEETNEKRYLAFPIIKNPAQRYFQRPRGTSRVFIDFLRFSSILKMFFDRKFLMI